MEVLYERCAGLDVHKQTVKVCLLTPGPDQRPCKELRTYGTKTQDLLELHDPRVAQRAGLLQHLGAEVVMSGSDLPPAWRPATQLPAGAAPSSGPNRSAGGCGDKTGYE